MPKFKVEFEETTQRIAIVYARSAQAARDAVYAGLEDDNYENPAPTKNRTITETTQEPDGETC